MLQSGLKPHINQAVGVVTRHPLRISVNFGATSPLLMPIESTRHFTSIGIKNIEKNGGLNF